MASKRMKDPNRTAPIYRVDMWDANATFSVIESQKGLTAGEAFAITQPLLGTRTAFRVLVQYTAQWITPVCESLFHPHHGFVTAPVDPTQYDVYLERAGKKRT